jgi:hypothetical protein
MTWFSNGNETNVGCAPLKLSTSRHAQDEKRTLTRLQTAVWMNNLTHSVIMT